MFWRLLLLRNHRRLLLLRLRNPRLLLLLRLIVARDFFC